ncbi:hypothetical protein HKD37_04G010713 [Glycine soja]|uniref:Uncharacterized protein n=1 Tax=Glycine soja TaxID=3848 RepID=A0A0B2PWZ5_GLYSO|nr:uncharacterized protein LOC114409606 [Glycine soja]KHN12082.1 hypothetical protein glysoja_047301 [Glycine soja]RZC16663.1 hypothetical protein D0Y65_009813 [Glycine soja]
MRERNKGVEDQSYTNDMDCYYYSTSEFTPCKKHPSSSSSSVGICAYCLKDRLVKLVCSDCGEQRLSSCPCSDEMASSHRNSCTVEVGSVGRVSFLIENENNNESTPVVLQRLNHNNKAKEDNNNDEDEVVVLRRSSSSCVEIKRHHHGGGGFWRIGKLFRKKKDQKGCRRSVVGFDERNSEMWVVDHQGGVSRSRSLCSFRGGGLFGSEDGGDSVLSGARSSISAARSSGVNMLESGRRSGYSEAEPRRSGFDGVERRDFLFDSYESGNDLKGGVKKGGLMDGGGDGGGFYGGVNRRVFSLRESDFKGMDESSFIDLKLDYSSESKHEFSAAKMSNNMGGDTFSSFRNGNFMPHDVGGGSYGGLVGDGVLTNGGSCRLTVNDRGIKRGRKSMKGWRWIFRYHSNWGSSRKRDEDFMFKA